jgi:hypothetical protein
MADRTCGGLVAFTRVSRGPTNLAAVTSNAAREKDATDAVLSILNERMICAAPTVLGYRTDATGTEPLPTVLAVAAISRREFTIAVAASCPHEVDVPAWDIPTAFADVSTIPSTRHYVALVHVTDFRRITAIAPRHRIAAIVAKRQAMNARSDPPAAHRPQTVHLDFGWDLGGAELFLDPDDMLVAVATDSLPTRKGWVPVG